MRKFVLPACLVLAGLVLQTTTGQAEEVTRVPLSSAEIEAYQSIANGNIEQLQAGDMDAGEVAIAALAALGILFLVLIIA